MRCMEIAQRMASIRSPEKVSVQSAMRAPASRSSMIGAMRPPLALPIGACATVIFDLPQSSMSGRSMWMQCAAISRSFSRPSLSMSCGGVRPVRAFTASTSSGSCERWVWTLPPCASASFLTSRKRSSEQVSGACGAQSQRMRPWSWPFQRAISSAFSARLASPMARL